MRATGQVNQLIERLPKREGRRFVADCEVVDLDLDAVLCELGHPIRFVYFPLNGFISLVAEVSGRPPMEVALIGDEGMLGATLITAVGESPLQAVVQGTGTALRMDAATFRQKTSDSAALTRLSNHCLYVLLSQLAHTVVCTNFHAVEPRLARWLLMVHDRAHSDQFHLTHEFLSDMLGVQRSAVTIAAGALQQQNLIGYSRGNITIIDRNGLEAVSCGCYEAAMERYSEIFS